MADAPLPAPPARLSRGRAVSVVGGRLVLIAALITGVALVASVAALPLVVPAGGLARDTANKLVDVPPLQEALPDPAQQSVIYAADGKTALATLWLDENRKVVSLRNIPHRVRKAVIAIEDDRFFEHDGVDFRGIARAAVADLRSGRIAQGGSTLTQQLVKLTITGNSRTLDRKLREAIYAVELERRYSKNQILEYYLNQAYFGEGVYGIATAAQHYFGNTSIKFVSLAQAAALAATIAAPERYKPTAKKANQVRRNLVLDRMLELGYATPKEVAKAKKEKIKVERYTPPRRQPYFDRFIVDQLLNDPKYNKALGKVGTDERKRKVFQGGLRIYTTLQQPKQAMATNAVQSRMDQFRGDPAGALASVEPSTGRIVALYAGKSFKDSQVDLATAKGGTGFQPGSAMKMFFVVAALEKGISPGIVLPGPARITIPNRRCYTGTGPWTPGNAGDSSAGIYNMYGATANSVNTWFAQLAVKVGPERAVEVARRMGITNIPPRDSKAYAYWNVCSLVLGAREVSVLDMAGAFGVLANKGVRCKPYSITKVVAPGERKPLIENKPDCDRVIDEKISTRTVAMLRGVITNGTGGRAALAGGRPVAGKTGSAQDNTSAFFSGFTPQLSTSVWVGYRARRVPMRTHYNGGPVYGGTFPAEIFKTYMDAALAGQPAVGFPAAPPPPNPPSLGVPDVVGLSQGQAQAVLARAGFQTSVRQIPSAQPRGRVVRQGPRAGTRLRQGGTVYLAVSGGRNGGNVVVPGVVGLQVSVARALLSRAGLRSGLAYTGSGQPGRVAAQSPGAGSRLPRGSYVTVVVSRRS
jgi:penicillin-binding protein 1A